jgi:hypothetical protein
MTTLVSGFALENMGSLLEHYFIDKLLGSKFANFKGVWDLYLCMRIKDEVVGQRYLQTIQLRFKFELAMAPAFVFLALGVGWLNALRHFWEWWPTFFGFCVIVVAAVVYLLFESYRSAFVLAKTRQLLVHHLQEGKAQTSNIESGSQPTSAPVLGAHE